MTSILVSFCVAAVLLSVSKWLLSDSEMKGITAFMVAIVFIATLFSFVSKKEFSLPTMSDINETSCQSELCEEVAATVIAALLDQEGIAYEKIETKANKQEDGGIIINKVTVYSKNCDISRITDTLYAKTQVEYVEVISD